MSHFTPIFLKFEEVGGGLKRKFFRKISLHPIISCITTADSTCSFVSLDYVPPPYLKPMATTMVIGLGSRGPQPIAEASEAGNLSTVVES